MRVTEGTRETNLLQSLMRKTHLSWGWATISIAAVLFILMLLAVSLDSSFTKLTDGAFWLNTLSGAILITYVLVIYPFGVNLRERVIQAVEPLLSQNDEIFNNLVRKIRTPNRIWEWLVLFTGLVLTVIIGQPWNLDWSPGGFWLSVYRVIVSPIFNCLLYWLIFDTLNSVVRITQLSGHPLELDILETDLLTPVAQYSLGISLIFIGGTSISLINKTWEQLLEWNNILTYSILIVAIVLMFFLSVWGTHNAISKIKNRELALARKHLTEASRELKERAASSQLDGVESLSATISLWATYQGLVQETPTWPFNANIIRRLIASIIVPAVVYFIKILTGLGIRF
ncbi:hypothetical protein ACFLXY_00795 [Chloroflexota bacterium]